MYRERSLPTLREAFGDKLSGGPTDVRKATMRRRDFFTTLAMPAAGLLATYERLTAADRGKVPHH